MDNRNIKLWMKPKDNRDDCSIEKMTYHIKLGQKEYLAEVTSQGSALEWIVNCFELYDDTLMERISQPIRCAGYQSYLVAMHTAYNFINDLKYAYNNER